MNERIRKLAEQANADELSYAYYRGEKRPENAVTLHSVDLEKFAELIVWECINIVKPTSHHEAFAPSYLGDVDGLELLDGKVKQIKQHFGVENENT